MVSTAPPGLGLEPDDTAPPVYIAQNYWMTYAARVIQNTYGDKVDIHDKGKQLLKFGRTSNADSGVKTTIASFGSVATINANETYSTTNDIDSVVSSDAGDTETLGIEGHTIDASGNLTFVSQEATLTGQTPVTLTTALARCNRMYVKAGTFAAPASDLVGDVYAYRSGNTVTAGVPQTSADVVCRIVAGSNQSGKAATSISSTDYYIITQVGVSVDKGAASTVTADSELEIRTLGGVFRPEGLELTARAGGSQQSVLTFAPYIIVPPNADVRLVSVSNTNDAEVSGFMNGVLASKV